MEQTENIIPYTINIHIIEKNNKPTIKLIKEINDEELIKTIITCAFHNKPIILQPIFTDRLKAISSLLEKGIIFKNKEDGSYYFTF